ncbi:MAG: protein kinase [Myxococcales bacterium]|nr:protein kinase [Myxococcales bacterium]
MEPGTVFADRYRIDQLLGEGGVGRVFRARDLQARPPVDVALKCLRPEYAREKTVRRRFKREARAAQSLQHAHIVGVHAYGDDAQGVPYIAMELLEGTPMSTLRDDDRPLEWLLAVVDQILSALAYIHARNIIHRDVKPENILVLDGPQGPQAKLVDFGFARVEDDADPTLTQANQDAFGTPQYMAPEQASGKGVIGPPTDIYAVGVLLYEFIAGHPPFTGAHGMAVALKHLMEAVPPLHARPGLYAPPGLVEIVYRALAKAPHERFATAADMRRALLPYRDDDDEDVDDTVQIEDAAARIAQAARAMGGFAEGAGAEVAAAAGRIDLGPEADAAPPAAQPIVGRDEDMLWLWQRVRVVCEEGAGRLVLLGAAQGMGKSRVVGWLRDQVAEGGWMFSIGGVHGPDSMREYGGLRGALDDLFGHLPDERAEAEQALRAIVQRWGAGSGDALAGEPMDAVGVSAIVSYLRPAAPGSVLHGAVDGEARGDVLYDRVCDALRLAALERPILLTLEGLERAGPETRTFLAHLADYLRRHPFPILAVVTYAADPDGRPQGAARAAVQGVQAVAGPEVEHHALGPLGADAIAQLLRLMAPLEDDVVRAIVRRTAGNPFFATELLLYLRQAGELVDHGEGLRLARAADPNGWPRDLPTTLRLRARGTLARLADPAFVSEVLVRSVVLGEAFDYALLMDYLVRVLGDEARVERAVEALLQSHLLLESRNPSVDLLYFAHGALWEAMRGELSEHADVGELHRRAAEAMVAYHAGATGPVAAEIAAHYQRAGAPLQAAEFYAEAAAVAREDGQLGRAFELLEAGDALLAQTAGPDAQQRRARMWLSLAEMELARDGFARAQSLAARVHAWARRKGHADLAGRALLMLGDLCRRQGQLPEAARAYAHAGQLFQEAGDARGVARCLLGHAMVERGQGEHDAAAQLYGQARLAMERIGDRLGTARAWQGLGELALRRGDFSGARLGLEQARDAFVGASDRAGSTFCEWLLGETQRLLQAPEAAARHFEVARRGYASLGDRGGLARCHLSLARLQAEAGSYEGALQNYQGAAVAFDALGDAERTAAVRAELGLLALARRRFDVAVDALSRALWAAVGAGDAAQEVVLRASLAWAAAEIGDQDTFEDQLAAALELDAQMPVLDDDYAHALEGIAEVDLYLGHAPRSAQLLARALEIHQSLGNADEAARVEDALRRVTARS